MSLPPRPLVLSLSKDVNTAPMGFDKLSPSGGFCD
jgi:hypothetical protein